MSREWCVVRGAGVEAHCRSGDAATRWCAGFVLAGGGSTRFGEDKALARVGGEILLGRLCDRLQGATGSVTIVGSGEKYGAFGKCIADGWPGEGPLGGIITALSVTAEVREPSEWNLIIGCDMPFLTRGWLLYLVERTVGSPGQVVVPESQQGLEPLCACWRTETLTKLRQVFEQGVRKVSEAMKHLHVEVLDEAHWKRFDSAGRLFWNINTPADYEEAKRILEAERG
jgi:molybdenum cofactor guanylyltransferase